MQKLPLGKQNFASVIEGDYLYVDKTEIIHRLISTGMYYFMSRPRRFGKSLLISTLKEIFSGRQDLFQNLWIHDRIEWTQHPVVHISFNTLNYKNEGLATVLSQTMDNIAQHYNIQLAEQYPSTKFRELIQKLSAKEKVVLLIDEYDKPIIDYTNPK